MNITSADTDEKKENTGDAMVRPHIYFVIDTTGSMSSYISSLNQVLDQIFTMVKILFGGKVFLHIISYKDYCDSEIIAQSHDTSKIRDWVKSNLTASGGGDTPEAAKTALNELYQHIIKTRKSNVNQKLNSLVLVYTDAPPHHDHVGSDKNNIQKERDAIKKKYKSPAPGFDWIEICKAFKRLNVPFYTFICRSQAKNTKLFWKCLGEIIQLPNTNTDIITKATIGTINQLMACNDETFIKKYAASFSLSKYVAEVDILSDNKIISEKDCKNLLPGKGSTSSVALKDVDFMQLKSLSFLRNVLQNLPKKLLYDSEFRDLVFAEFRNIFTKENVLCLSYNAVFGTIWRYLCRFREDDRLKTLKNKFSLIIDELPETQKNEMQEWLDESYDDTEEINEIIKKHLDGLILTEQKQENMDVIEYITLDAIDAIDIDLLPTKKELLTITHSLYGDIIYKVQNIMTHLIVIKKKRNEAAPFDDKVINSYIAIPYSMDNKTFFALLSHLVIPGTRFTLRPTLIMSMIAYLSGNVILKERAKALLLENKGKWITLDDDKLQDWPEFISVPFVKLVIRCNKGMDNNLLTKVEAAFYDKLYKVYRVRLSRPKLFDLKIGFSPKVRDISKDFKRKCNECSEFRSFTLMLENDKCAKCHWKEDNIAVCLEYADLKVREKDSHLVSCRSCQAIYAVVDVNLLNVGPKCHYCREGVEYNKIPVINCAICLNRWILPNKKYFGNININKWKCPCCTETPSRSVDTTSVSFETLIDSYSIILSKLFGINDKKEIVKDLFSSMSLYKLYMKYKKELYLDDCDDDKDDEKGENINVINILMNQQAKYKGKRIHNISEFIENIIKSVNYGKLSDICCLCFGEKKLILLESACGLCSNLMCAECLKTWYNQLNPGRIVLPSHLLCAFCKQKPSIKTMKKYNKQICTIIGGKKTKVKQLSTSNYYGWCIDCYQIKEAMKRECLRESMPNLNNFKCEECTEIELMKKMSSNLNNDENYVKENYPQCPGCEMSTAKISGCNHITCNCGTHWCYECGEEFSPDYIYDHMSEAHGY